MAHTCLYKTPQLQLTVHLRASQPFPRVDRPSKGVCMDMWFLRLFLTIFQIFQVFLVFRFVSTGSVCGILSEKSEFNPFWNKDVT